MIDAGDKYIIELEAAYGFVHGDGLENVPTLYRVKGFRSLVFDEEGLKKLVPLDQMRPSWWDEAYEKGLDDAWAAARKITVLPSQGGFTVKELAGIFGDEAFRDVMQKRTASEALAKLRDYEARKKAEAEAVKVGDELVHLQDSETKAVVTRIGDDGRFSGVSMSIGTLGAVFWNREPQDWRKTGRNFPEIAAVLEQMKGE